MMPPAPPAPPRRDLGFEPPGVASPGEVPWHWWHAILVYFLGFLALGTIIALLVLIPFGGDRTEGTGLGLPLLVASGVADATFAVVMVLWLRSRTPSWPEAVRLPMGSQRIRDFATGLGLGLVLYPAVAVGVGTILIVVIRAITGETVTAPDQLSPGLSTGARVLAGIFAIAIAPVVEELFFRGILFRSLRRHGFWTAAIVSSLVFGSVHYVGGPAANALFLMIVTASTGLGLAVIYEWRGLAASIGAHVTFNAIGVAVIFTLA